MRIHSSKRLVSIVLWIVLAAAFVYACVYLDANVDQYVDPDMSSELVLAKHLHQTGRFLSQDWYYSTELRVLNTQLVFAPLFALTENWHTVRVAGTIALYLIMLASAYYCCRQLGARSTFPLVGLLLISPMNVPYVDIIIKGVFYIPHVSIAFGLLGLMAHFIRADKGRAWLLAGNALLSFAAGLGGLRIPVVFHAPALLAAIWMCLRLREKHPEIRSAQHLRLLVAASVGLASALAGCAVNSLALSRIYSFHQFDSLSFIPFDPSRITPVLQAVMTFFGYHSGLISLQPLLFNGLMAVLSIGFIAAGVSLLRASRPEDAVSPLPYTVALCGIAVLVLLYSLSDQGFWPTYVIPVLVFAWPVLALGLERLNWNNLLVPAGVLLTVVMLLMSNACKYQLYWEGCSDPDAEELKEIAEEMVDRGYTVGYSAFWNGGNLLTELSNGQLDMYVASIELNEKLDNIAEWLQARDHVTNRPSDPFFVLLSRSQMRNTPLGLKLDDTFLVYSSESCSVFGFDSYEEYAEVILQEE